jgi:phage terminase large subunit GpA-like protein
MTSETIINVFSEAIASAIPESSLTVSQWAATYRFLSAERSARPGRWRNDLAPYLVEIMDTVGKPGVREIVLVASAQVGKTECANNILGFFMHADPSPIIFVAETDDKAEAWSKESLAPMIRDTPVLANLVGDARSRDSNNTIGGKSFPGGHLAIAHATSPATLSSRPRRVVILDERDAFKTTSEGDPAKLAEKRATTFPDAVIVKVSTPRDRLELEPGAPLDARRFTAIELEYENSDQRKYFVPCPHCREYQALVWARVKWDEGKAGEAYYVCESGCVIEHEYKQEMLARGEWRAEKPFAGRAGFHIWEGYSPFVTWGEMALNFLEAKKSRATLKVFVNTSLGEGWEETTEQASTKDLESHRETYEAEVPDGVLVVVASADVQGDRIETEIVGFGLHGETWSLDYQVLPGDPSQQQVWEELKHLWMTPLARADGSEVSVMAACVDSGGHHTQEVYRFCRENAGRRWYPVKGANTPGKPLVSKPTLQGRPPVRLFTVGTETAKDTIAANLLVEERGPGYCHFPAARGDDYFRQLRSERPVMRFTRGVSVRKWEKAKPSARNEALDCRVYAMAACAILNPNWRRLHEAMAKRTLAPGGEAEEEPEQSAAHNPPPQSFAGRNRKPNSFANGWR